MTIYETYKVTVAQMRSKSQRSDICEARQMQWLILNENGIHVTDIANEYNRTRSTVLHGIKHIKGLIEVDKSVRQRYQEMKTK
jgi:chromosomal replication initiation ATPase DnaA